MLSCWYGGAAAGSGKRGRSIRISWPFAFVACSSILPYVLDGQTCLVIRGRHVKTVRSRFSRAHEGPQRMKDGMKAACPARRQHWHDISVEAGNPCAVISRAGQRQGFKDSRIQGFKAAW